MLRLYTEWYNYSVEALNYEVENPRSYTDVDRIVILGMGGSAIAGDVVAAIAMEYSGVPVFVWKDFRVPKALINNRTLVIAVSYSGNTRETILSLLLAMKNSDKVGVVASGGKLIELACQKRIPYVRVRSGLVPRVALPLLMIAIVKLAYSCGVELIPYDQLLKGIEILKNVDEVSRKASELATFLSNSVMPVIVSTLRYSAIAYRIKNELNENSKMPAKVEIAPELFHNDIVGWEASKFVDKAIVIESELGYEKEILKMYADYLKSRGFEVFKLGLEGENLLAKYLYGFLVAGIASIKLAEIRGLDPLETKSISRYKELVVSLEESIMRSLSI